MKYARIVNSIAVETFTVPAGLTIQQCFTAELVAQFTTCPAEVQAGWIKQSNGSFKPTAPVPAPEPPAPAPTFDYVAFWDALIISTVYASIRTQSMASLPMNTLATEFIALIGDAKDGRPNEAAIQASMSAVFSTGTFTTADAAEFTAALAAGSLDDTYSLS
jgi:hypothetical protein